MAWRINIQGLVQGVGFRPFVWRLAHELGISGSVANCNNGVVIEIARGDEERVRVLLERIKCECPPVAAINCIDIVTTNASNSPSHLHYIDGDFIISPSDFDGNEITQVAPDIAVCSDCMRDRENQSHRLLYPFINCTNCGPRFSIIKDLPYDRPRTTMAAFEMCPRCRSEYDDPRDRRFHAQPVACNHCGPEFYATHRGELVTDYARLLALTTRLLSDGGVIAIKGVGGYHLACDATNESAVNRLRGIKRRDSKPFAVLFQDVSSVERFAVVASAERENLESWRRPIVLLPQRAPLASGVNPGMRTLGCLLANQPIHYDWFARLTIPALVLTSGNVADAPIAIDEAAVLQQFSGNGEGVVDLFLHHNRDIHNRVDDSVVQVCGMKTCVIRRSRGYAPEPFFADVATEGVLAFGAEKTGAFALGRGTSVFMSQHFGDLQNWETFAFYEEALARFQRLFRFRPRQLVCDLHPDYLSTHTAEKMAAARNLPLLRVQHHHAHAVAGMLEHRLHEPLIAVVWDAVGLGDDGKIWGGEFFLCDRRHYQRLAHLDYVPMPGGDKTALEPWRMAIAWLRQYQLRLPEGFIGRNGQERVQAIEKLLESDTNCPRTSSAGRLFDAFASLLGVCDTATRQGEAPVLLEQKAVDDFSGSYEITDDADAESISMRPLFECVLTDMGANVPTSIIAAKLHETLARLIVRKIRQLQRRTGVTKALVTGGCFQNKRLIERVQTLCEEEKIELYIPEVLPANDSGVAAGQLAIATATMQ